ncbi:MAG TPA: hypothetical protein VHB97_18180 [Polyangia bacterium]|jgi:hypothetical protein|nr:hypothetical protein [Polyangia bacterium]
MLLNALWSPEVQHQTSAYVNRAGEVAGSFLYGVAIMSVVIFVFAVVSSMRVSPEPPK